MRLPVALGVLSLMSVLVAGCSSSGGGGAAGPGGGQADQPAAPRVNRVVFASPPPQLEGNNPSRSYSAPSAFQLRPMYEYLIGIDARGKRGPQLATDWMLEPDGRSYRFTVRHGVRFHGDWGEVTAKDIAAVIKDISQPDSLSGSAPFWRLLTEGVEEVNPYEAIVHMKAPNAEILGNISQQLSGSDIKSSANYAKVGHTPALQEAPIAGTGPYQFKERAQGQYVRFERVPYEHWRHVPAFPELELRWINEASTRLAGLLAGEIHLTPLPEDLQAQAQRSGMKVAAGTTPGVRAFLQFRGVHLLDSKDPSKGYKFPNSPLMDPRVRQALSKAVNRDELNKTLLGGKGEVMVLNHFHPTREGWNPEWVQRFPEAYGYDPAKARALLADAGYTAANPLRTSMVMLTLAELPQSQDIQEAIAGYWRAVGIQVALLNVDRAEDERLSRTKEYPNHLTIFTAPSDQYLGVRTFNTYTNAVGGSNVDMPAVDAGYNERVLVTLDDKKREQMWRDLGESIFTSFQHVPLFWLPVQVTYNPSIVAGMVFPGSTSGLYTHLELLEPAA